METPAISLLSPLLHFQELVTSTVFDGYMGIQSTNEMDFVVPTIFFLAPIPIKKRSLYNK
ncbi:hypothetical protein SLEP1_g60399 [Rubroshorea leprosula]|uniref:Uncharacterized protein n=1 Tax=Rubroshorea leprosula TaxID=152421 RepID=A0AAV5MV58_9ROSI|nr:hypothetical protein SLEP1_g60399 [Rubroshorea leprosula]